MRVHTIGVRVNVGVAESAAMNTCIRSVLAAAVMSARWSMVGVAVGAEVAEEAAVLVMGWVVGEEAVDVAVSAGG